MNIEERIIETARKYCEKSLEFSEKEKAEIVQVLRYSSLILKNRKGNYKTEQYDLTFKYPIFLLELFEMHEEEIKQLIRHVCNGEFDGNLNLYCAPKLITERYFREESVHDIYYDNIQKNIIQAIRESKYCIWCMVAWINNDEIKKEIIRKSKDGIDVKILVSDKSTNNLNDLKEHCDVKIVKNHKGEYAMLHNKISIIDFSLIVGGSANYTNNANLNDENIRVDVDKKLVSKSANEFLEIWSR
ncbi:phospholipase D-like domain-containing protein [Mammaliicoccus sciuri]|uniref:phospholipase D-like domain-containing protein n=1 Tax=Mammaliicoccus sciuri TaxID=1296 RepID=UPI00065B5A1A|nr:phospholipase D-like domain-containing protein [Mammaliicoccus sciuri]PNY95991.1 hypothetical protein CD035_03230 [Mammaliicoccus sciuri]WRY62509.1 phospholipase D-like domain-containing protein [Mammaliicoccus sciuri]SQE51091.1 nuclease NucT [Mammaliicoccus sciuri]